ncbi:hypothetical protein [Methylobacterium nigriterrae]|uniref:hypothetical protein n=1 Tax=Methylobacterium nigriterrae TaxID=3127512 RepID=UPI003013E403
MTFGIVASLIPAAFLAASEPARAQSYPQEPSLLLHGNYCGLGNNAPFPPIDALDAACARHDACTPAGGLPSRACNLRLQREAGIISRDLRQPDDVRALAGFISVGAAALPFDPAPPVTVRAPVPARYGWDPTGLYRPVYVAR